MEVGLHHDSSGYCWFLGDEVLWWLDLVRIFGAHVSFFESYIEF